MTKTFLKSILLGLGLLLVAPLALASTIDMSPTTVSVEANKTFTVQVYINPQGATYYSTKLELKYPADLMQVSSFTLSDTWMALKQTGYDATDNVNGVLLKTGGYPGGFSAKILFGTVTFTALKAGAGNISVGSNANVPNASNANTLTASTPVVVTITAAAAPKTTTQPQTTSPKTTTQPKTTTGQQQPATTEQQQTQEQTQEQTEQQPQEQAQTQPTVPATSTWQANVASVVTLGTNNPLVGFLVIVIVLVLLYYAYKAYNKPKP